MSDDMLLNPPGKRPVFRRDLVQDPQVPPMVSDNAQLAAAWARHATDAARIAALEAALAQSQYALSYGKAILRDYGTLAVPPIDDALDMARAALGACQ